MSYFVDANGVLHWGDEQGDEWVGRDWLRFPAQYYNPNASPEDGKLSFHQMGLVLSLNRQLIESGAPQGEILWRYQDVCRDIEGRPHCKLLFMGYFIVECREYLQQYGCYS